MSNKVAFTEAVAAMRAVHPRLDLACAELLDGWDMEPPPTVALFDVFADATRVLLREADPNLQPLFDLVERLLDQGDPQVTECVAVGFVESLSNTPEDDLDPVLWKNRLGPRALAHAQAYADFWGSPY